MVIQLPEWDGWRISGEALSWEVQKLVRKKQGEVWEPTNYFPSLDAAIGYAYERTLRECGMGHTVDMMREALVQCERTKSSLLREARKVIRK